MSRLIMRSARRTRGVRSFLTMCTLFVGMVACAHYPQQDLSEYLDEYWHSRPEPSHFSICSSHGCSVRHAVSLDDSEWAAVRAAFQPRPSQPEEERKQIARPIAYLEAVVGKKTGTDADKGGSFPGMFMKNQLDCVDEMVNTAGYLAMMNNDGLIEFHELREPVQRGNFIRGWPHVASVIAERSSGRLYVVDSWFFDNGQPPVIIPLEEWMNGWQPGTTQ